MDIDSLFILKKIKLHYGFNSDAQFARFLGVSPQTLSNWQARNSIDFRLLYTKCVDINADWLLTGKGEMLRKESKVSLEDFNIIQMEHEKLKAELTELKKINAMQEKVILAQDKSIELLEDALKAKDNPNYAANLPAKVAKQLENIEKPQISVRTKPLKP